MIAVKMFFFNDLGVIPLCENMPSGMAMKPGDVVAALDGKNIMIEDTDNEGRIILTDALVYANMTYIPRLIIDVGSFTCKTWLLHTFIIYVKTWIGIKST